MKILFIHQNFPGQFRHLAPALKARGHEVKALSVQGPGLPDIESIRHAPAPGTTAGQHPWVAEFEAKLRRGTSAMGQMLRMAREGWTPDLVVMHPSWGEGLFVKDVWPQARVLCFLEFYYGAFGRDFDFDPEFSATQPPMRAGLRLKNTAHLLALDTMDQGWSPTRWQRSTFPAAWQDRIDVAFDGVDTGRLKPDPQARLTVQTRQGTQRTLRAGDEVVTYTARHLEPYRGYHRFMRALPAIQAARPHAVTVIVGGDGNSYSSAPPEGRTWKQVFLDEVRADLDLSRIIFLPMLPPDAYLRVLQVSACHVYLTYPFVLSWSCVEALSAGCLVVGSRTAPVEEVVQHGHNGMLVDFFDTPALAAQVSDALARPDAYRAMRAQARQDVVARYDLHGQCLPAQLQLVDTFMRG